MKEYIGLAVCQLDNNEKKLFETPAWRSLATGDRVIVEGSRENSGNYATVLSAFTARTKDSFHELEFILTASGETMPLKKVVAKVEYDYFKYEEDDYERTDKD